MLVTPPRGRTPYRAALVIQSVAVLVCCVPLAAYAVSNVRLVVLLAPVTLFAVAAVLRLAQLAAGTPTSLRAGPPAGAVPEPGTRSAAVLVLARDEALGPLTDTLVGVRSLLHPDGVCVGVVDGAGRPEV